MRIWFLDDLTHNNWRGRISDVISTAFSPCEVLLVNFQYVYSVLFDIFCLELNIFKKQSAF